MINPADDGSRGVSAQYYHTECCWWSGPKFLWEPEHTWPIVPVEEVEEVEEDREIRRSPTIMFISNASQINLLLQCYSSWSYLLRVVSWVLRFVKRARKEVPEHGTSSMLKLVELKQSSQEIVRLVQHQHFHEEYVSEGRQTSEMP